MGLSLGFNNVKVDQSGRVSVAGARSGLDWHELVDKMVAAKSIPIDMISRKITADGEQLVALNDIQSKAGALKSVLSQLYGEHTYDSGKDIFEKKAGVTSTITPGSPSTDLLGASAKNSAKVGQYEVEITEVALAHKIHSKIIPFGVGAAAGLAGAMVLQDPVTLIDKATINILPTDNLLTVVDKINNSASDVMASVISIDATHSKIVLQSKKTGENFAIQFSPSSTQALVEDSGLGFATFSGTYTVDHEVDPPQNAMFSVDGVPIIRQSNVITDVVQDVTFQVLKKEPGTKVKVSIERDVSAIRSQVEKFVAAYNDLLVEANTQAHRDPNASTQKPLYNTTFIRGLKSQLGRFVTVTPLGSSGVKTLQDVGIVANTGLGAMNGDYRTIGQLSIDQNKMDQAIVGDIESFRRFFVLDFVSSDAEVALSKFKPSIMPLSGSAGVFNINTNGVNIINSTFNEGSVTTTPTTVEVTSGPAKGLILSYTGPTNKMGVQISYTIGAAVQMMGIMDNLLNEATGLITQNIKMAQSAQSAAQKSKDQKLLLIEQYRQRLLKQNQRMEQKVSESRAIMGNIEAMFKKNDNN